MPELCGQSKPVFTLKVILAMLAVYIIWGTTLGAMHVGIETIPPLLLVCTRFLVAGGLLTLFCLAKKEALPTGDELKKQAIIGIFLFFLGNAVSTWCVQYIPTGLAGLIVATTPFWMVGLAAVFPPREKMTLPVLGGILLGFTGMAVLLSPKLSSAFAVSSSASSHTIIAIVMMSLTSLFWSLGSVYMRKQRLKTSMLMGVGIQNLAAGLLLVPVCLYKQVTFGQVSLPSVLALLHLIINGTIVATPCYFYILKTMPVSVTSTFAYVTPVITVLVGVLFLQESLSPTTVLGSLIILSGVVLVQVLGQKKPDEPGGEESDIAFEPMCEPAVLSLSATGES